VMQVLVVAVQNSVPHARLGTATSTATFFRTIGGAFGVAALGAVFNNRLLSQLRGSKLSGIVSLVKSGSIAANPAQLNKLPPAIKVPVIAAFNRSLQDVFLIAVPTALVAFGLCFLMREAPLRNTAFVAPTSRHDAQDHAAEDHSQDHVDLPAL
jgi:hypothetical protein